MKIYQVESCYAYEGGYTELVSIDRHEAYTELEKRLNIIKKGGFKSDKIKLTSWLNGEKLEEITYTIYDEIIRPL